MDSSDNEKAWMAAWRLAGPDFERLRREELRNVDTVAAIRSLAGLDRYRLAHLPPDTASELVEQQRWFMLARQ